MKLETILRYDRWLRVIIDEKDKFEIDYSFKFKCLTKLKEIEPYTTNFDQLRMELIREYGEQDEDGNIEVKEDTVNHSNFAREINNLLEQEIDGTVTKFKQSEIFNQGIPSDYIMALYDLDLIEK